MKRGTNLYELKVREAIWRKMNCGYKSSMNLRLSLRRTTAILPAETRRSGEILQLDQAQQETTECGRIETGKGGSV